MEDIDSTLNNLNQNETVATNQTGEELRSECRLKALKLIMFYLRQPQPNLAHLLLGMDIKKPLGNQEFYNPGERLFSLNPSWSNQQFLINRFLLQFLFFKEFYRTNYFASFIQEYL